MLLRQNEALWKIALTKREEFLWTLIKNRKQLGINKDFERKATDFFKHDKFNDGDETDSLFNKKTFESTQIDFANFQNTELEHNDLIYDDTTVSMKPITRIIIEDPVLSNLLFQMLIFYNYFYFWLQFFIFFTMMINKLWIFDYQNYRDFIAYGWIVLYFPIEICSWYFGYKGNINESVSV